MNNYKEIEFFEKEHKYYYRGLQLSGITCKLSNTPFPENVPHIDKARVKGTYIHNVVEDALTYGHTDTYNEDVLYVLNELDRKYPISKYQRIPERLVSDFKQYASAIDILIFDSEDRATIIDIKTGVFKRDYCSQQLGIYKKFLEDEGIVVDKCYVIATRDRFMYPIIPVDRETVDSILYEE